VGGSGSVAVAAAFAGLNRRTRRSVLPVRI
jgi:hypothetical protein